MLKFSFHGRRFEFKKVKSLKCWSHHSLLIWIWWLDRKCSDWSDSSRL